MKHLHLLPQGLRRCKGGRDERGSAILLVLVTLVLMSILAGSLLQLTRFERIPRAESNIDVVVESVVAEILTQATEDLIDDNGRFLNPNDFATGGGDEAWDFPWTNLAPASTGVRQPLDIDGNPVPNVRGGLMDDTWLAAQMPEFGTAIPGPGTAYANAGGTAGGANGQWRKISDLTGNFLRGANGTSDLSSGAAPIEDPVNFNTINNRNMNIPTGSPILVDADGDGIGDSRWEWAPLRQVGATRYVMAVRVVDLSARMDVNVATGRFNATDASASRGDSPAELNGDEFVTSIVPAGDQATVRNEWREGLNYHLTGVLPNPPDLIGATEETRYDENAATPAVGSRADYWRRGAALVSNTFDSNGANPAGAEDYSNSTFGLTDAYELLRGNGFNSNASTPLENLMPTLTRRNNAEDNFAVGNTNGWSQQQFWRFDPRKHMSIFTGSSVAVKPAATTAQNRELKLDVNEAVRTGNLGALRQRILDFLNTANGAALVNEYPHLTSNAQLADQLTVNIADYIDSDNQVSQLGTATGFEALPYISEVYTQRYYQATAVAPPVAPSTDNQVTWSGVGAQGYVIEIANPFAPDTSGRGRPVSLTNVWIDINGSQLELGGIAGVPTELAPGDVVLLYRSSGGALGVLDNYHSSNANNTTGGFTTVHTGIGPPMPRNTQNVTIGLRAALQGSNTPAGFNYSAVDIELGGNSVTEPATANAISGPPVPPNHFSYIQTHYVGHAVGLRMMTVTKGGGSNDYVADTSTLDDPSVNCDVVAGGAATQSIPTTLANEVKASTPTGFGNLDNAANGGPQQIVWPDSERQRMHWIGDILQIPLIGLRGANANDATMAEAFIAAAGGTALNNPNTGTGVEALMLPYQSGIVINGAASSGVLNYPHAALLMEQLTTFSPATDGLDGDNGDGDDNALTGGGTLAAPDLEEVLVPGRININTASRETLERLLPFPDLATRQAVARAIVERRESTQQSAPIGSGGYGMGSNGLPGIAYSGALYEQIATLPNGFAPTYVNISRDGANSTGLGGGNARIDWNDHEETLGTFVPVDGVVDDREEEIMLAKWLSEVADTRSDIFAAYIVVQGYPAGDFSGGAVESARLIILFSRAGVETTGDRAVEIGRIRLN
jgi:hypothetical protein